MGITAIRMPSGIGIPLAAAGRSNSLSVTQRNELTVSAHGATKMLYVKRPKAIYGSAAQEKGYCMGTHEGMGAAARQKRFELLAETFRSGKAPEGSFWKITEDGIISFVTQIYFKNESEDAYLRRNGLAPDQRMVPDAYSFLQDGDWHSKGEMGWWGISSNDKKPDAWRQMLADYIDSIPDDHFIVGIDCHI